jgi:hypothetical protein
MVSSSGNREGSAVHPISFHDMGSNAHDLRLQESRAFEEYQLRMSEGAPPAGQPARRPVAVRVTALSHRMAGMLSLHSRSHSTHDSALGSLQQQSPSAGGFRATLSRLRRHAPAGVAAAVAPVADLVESLSDPSSGEQPAMATAPDPSTLGPSGPVPGA